MDLSPEYLAEFNNQRLQVHKEKTVPGESENILITSALPYVNNVPHLGNLIGCVLSADVFARYKRLNGDNVMYICGTDEYGTATEVKAFEEGKTPQEVCDYYFKIHDGIYKWFDIDFDYFGRTSTPWHTTIVQEIFNKTKDNGRIFKDKMNQCYCEKCDRFLADRYVVGTCPNCKYDKAKGDQCDKCQKLLASPIELEDAKCKLCGTKPYERETEHFYIDLPKAEEDLVKWLKESSKKGEWTENSIAVSEAWIKKGLKPVNITRDLKWGVPVPVEGYEKKVFYVWFDAPIGYISITANYIQEDYKLWWQNPKQVKLYQFMGKDNIPFHTVIFPASLISSQLDWTLLHHISTTEYLNYEDGKFSKSEGTGVFGDSAQSTGIPSEVWRYYLLINRPECSDTVFSWEDFAEKNNKELLNNVGNLCNRVLKFIYNDDKQIPKVSYEDLTENEFGILKIVEERFKKYTQLLDKVEIKEGLKTAMEISSLVNKYIQDSKPFDKQTKESGRSKIIIGVACNLIRFVSLLLEPYIPSTSAKINFLLGCEVRTPRDNKLIGYLRNEKFDGALLTLLQDSKGIREPVALFRTLTKEEIEQWRNTFKGKQK